MSVMLYKAGGAHKLHGLMCDYQVVDEDHVAEQLAEGWAMSPTEAHAEVEPIENEPQANAKPEETSTVPVNDDETVETNVVVEPEPEPVATVTENATEGVPITETNEPVEAEQTEPAETNDVEVAEVVNAEVEVVEPSESTEETGQ